MSITKSLSRISEQPEPGLWQGRKVLVTGAGGFIGSHLVERLVEEGAVVRGMVHYNAMGHAGWLEHSRHRDAVEVVAGDITDRDSVRHALQHVEVVFHLAALIAIPYSYQAPNSYVRTNMEGTVNVLQAARDLGTARVVHTSTSEVYGSALYVPMDERHPLQGQSPYSASKIGADQMAQAFHRSFGVPVVTVRPFNTFGPRQSARAVIPTIITQCLAGNVVRLGKLSPMRDLNFVGNTVDGFLAAASVEAAIGQTVNLGSGSEISIGGLASLIAKMMNRSIRIETDEVRLRPGKSEVERLLASNGLAASLLHWTPRVDLEEGLAQTIPWMEKNQSFYRPQVYAV